MEEVTVILILIFTTFQMLWLRRRQIEESERNLRELKRRRERLRKRLEFTMESADASLFDELLRRRNQTLRQVIASFRRRRPPVTWIRSRSSEWWDNTVSGFTDGQWIKHFRVSSGTFQYVCHKLQSVMERRDTKFRLCVPLRKRVAIGLWKLATNSKYRNVARLFGVGITTAWRCVSEFCTAVTEVFLPRLMQIPDPEKLAEISDYFERRWSVPNCVGVVHVSHIPIVAPQEYQCDYLNQQDWHSVILQAVVDGRGLFWHVCVGIPGSVHDAKVLKQSDLWQLGNNAFFQPNETRNIGGQEVGYYLIGDAAYPLQKWLMKPYFDTGTLTGAQRTYNSIICTARSVIDNAFDRLQGRWQCLVKRSDCNVNLVKSMVLTCCILHNLCESRGEVFREEWRWPAAPQQPTVPVYQERVTEGTEVREALLHYFASLQQLTINNCT
uniref:Putative nuclease HARBI1 n=1 Tax=Erpetoichthys calabaricus TaxID=27687 RepID=A0A8C4RM29_ERPCA